MCSAVYTKGEMKNLSQGSLKNNLSLVFQHANLV